MLQIYCGDGKGKTTAAVGACVRMLGYGKKVLFVQFLKDFSGGEIKMLKQLGATVLCCENNYGFWKDLSEAEKAMQLEEHNRNILYVKLHMSEFDMIVLDEICAAHMLGAVRCDGVKYIIENYTGELILTGREPCEFFVEKADYISCIEKEKHPFDNGILAREGIEY